LTGAPFNRDTTILSLPTEENITDRNLLGSRLYTDRQLKTIEDDANVHTTGKGENVSGGGEMNDANRRNIHG